MYVYNNRYIPINYVYKQSTTRYSDNMQRLHTFVFIRFFLRFSYQNSIGNAIYKWE